MDLQCSEIESEVEWTTVGSEGIGTGRGKVEEEVENEEVAEEVRRVEHIHMYR